ncbi:DUF2264 domain-containing protein [Thalassotalea montiporae]
MISLPDLKFIFLNQSQNLKRQWSSKRAKTLGTDKLIQEFSNAKLTVEDRCNLLARYFWQGQSYYANHSRTRAYYPGAASIYGANNDGIEGVTRLMPLWAVMTLNQNFSQSEQASLQSHLFNSLLNGTNPEHTSFWGEITDKSTLICEAADVALALWLVRDTLWHKFSKQQQTQILSWLKQVPYKQTADNNWHLFVVLVAKVIASFEPAVNFDAKSRFNRVKCFYQGEGCFKDGSGGAVDLYNAWGFHYALYWIDQIDPDFDSDFIHRAISEYSEWFQYLFTEHGFPLFGRSLCYKMALPVPLIAANDYNAERFSPDIVASILDATLRFFISNGGVVKGRMSQGVFGDDIRWLDPYSGPASAFWGTRSLVMYYFVSQKNNWRQASTVELPYRKLNQILTIAPAQLKILANPNQNTVKVKFLEKNQKFKLEMLLAPSSKDRLRQLIYGIAQRPANNLQKLGIGEFSSDLAYYHPRFKNSNN